MPPWLEARGVRPFSEAAGVFALRDTLGVAPGVGHEKVAQVPCGASLGSDEGVGSDHSSAAKRSWLLGTDDGVEKRGRRGGWATFRRSGRGSGGEGVDMRLRPAGWPEDEQ